MVTKIPHIENLFLTPPSTTATVLSTITFSIFSTSLSNPVYLEKVYNRELRDIYLKWSLMRKDILKNMYILHNVCMKAEELVS